MGPDLGLKDNPKTAMDLVSSGKEHKTVTRNPENYKALDEEAFGDDATENSSSFGDSGSEMEGGSVLCDAEVQSQEYGEISGLGCDGFEGPLTIRKKMLTDHWRKFIQPLRWRCKWLELHLTEHKRQQLKYDRQLAEYNEQKQFAAYLGHQVVNSEPQPFPCQIDGQKVMKRMKRKQVEQSADIVAYMSNHSLFSYYGSRKLNLVRASETGGCGKLDNRNIIGNEVLEPVEFKENSSEPILRSIEMLQSQVHALKARIDKVLSENPWQFSPANMLDFLVVPSDTLAGSQVLHSGNGDKMPLRSLYDSSQPVGVVSSHGERTWLPDIIESLRQQIVSSHETTEEEILIDNEAAREEFRDFEQLLSPAWKTTRQAEIAHAVQYVTPQARDLLAANTSELCAQPNPELPSATESKDLNKEV